MFDVNVPLLRKTLEHITAHPEEWDQASWAQRDPVCGTKFCLAGTAVALQGHEFVWNEYECECCQNIATKITGGLYIEEQAAADLGLSSTQADRLFNAGNSLNDLWDIAASITDGRIEKPIDLVEPIL